MPSRHGRGLLAACALLLAVGCASLAPAPGGRSYSGRFALRVEAADGRRDASSGRFALAIDGGTVILDLASPLGTTLARVQADAQGATLTVRADGGVRITRGADAAQLAAQVLGWPLPIAGLPDWIEGRPAPGAGSTADGGDAFHQDGWTVRVDERDPRGRVRRLGMSRPAAGAGPAVDLRIVVEPAP